MAYSNKSDECWHIANTPLTFRVTHIEFIDEDTYLMTAHLTHGQFSWNIKRLFQYQNGSCKKQKTEQMADMSSDSTRRTEKLSYLKGDITIFLKNLLESYSGMMEFLGISPLSFIEDLGPKGPEGFILVNPFRHSRQMMECWLVVKDSFLLYMSRDHKVLHVMLFDPELNVQLEEEQTQDLLSEDRINPELQILVEEKKINPELHVSMEARRMNNVLQVLEENCPVIMCIKNASSELTIKCSSYRQARWWKEEIQRLSLDCDFFKTRHLGCFAPPRPNSDTKWYVNGSGYFADLADALENAKEEIFITDWWLSPEIFLKERPAQNNQWRLEQILKRKAEAGVKVYLLLYKEVPFTVSTDSKYSKRTLMDLHNNIKVMRYPNHVTSRVFLWSHHEKLVAIDQSMAFMGGLDLAFGRWDDSNYRLTDVLVSGTDIQGACSVPKTKRKAVAGGADNQNTLLWLGKDYNNFFMKDWTQMDKPFEDIVDRTVVPRIPWRDLGAMVHGKAARDLSRHFIQRWNFTKNSKMKSKATIYPYLLPKSHNTAAFSDSDKPSGEPGKVEATVQVLRSVGLWSAGTSECSIQKAYIETIKNSQHYVYIENQFFISVDETAGTSAADETPGMSKGITDAIVDRILLAHEKGQKYRVFLVIPLLPGVKGDISKGGSTNMCAIMHYTYSTINRGEGSIIKRLEKKMEDKWTQYFSVCSLRTHSELNGKPISELVYVHSKLLIADDLCYIIGSANINDRSMMGDRDSELAVLVVDNAKVQSRMNEGEYNAGSLTLALRKECFRVLLGSDSNPTINIDDPVSDNFFNEVWNKTAHENTSTYERVFQCLPSNSIHSLRELQEHVKMDTLAQSDPETAAKDVRTICGILVYFPLDFLCEENLLPKAFSKKGMLPERVWT